MTFMTSNTFIFDRLLAIASQQGAAHRFRNTSTNHGYDCLSKRPLVGQTFRVDKSVIILWRNPNNDIVIPDPKVSRNHARLVLNEDTWSIENVSQNSPITINQQRVEKGEILFASK